MCNYADLLTFCLELLKLLCVYFRFAEGHNLVALRDFALSFIYNNFFAVTGQEEFRESKIVSKYPFEYLFR